MLIVGVVGLVLVAGLVASIIQTENWRERAMSRERDAAKLRELVEDLKETSRAKNALIESLNNKNKELHQRVFSLSQR